MDQIRDFFALVLHADELLKWGGYPALMLIVFAETGLLIGFFLPGDSLLVTAGVFVQANLMNPFNLDPFVNLLVMNVTQVPDFTAADLDQAVKEFHSRERRFGTVPAAAAG